MYSSEGGFCEWQQADGSRVSCFGRVKGDGTGCVIDCSADVTWSGLHFCSCTAARNSGYFMERKTLARCAKDIQQEKSRKRDRCVERYWEIVRMRREADSQWWIQAELSAVSGSEQLIWSIDEERVWWQGRVIVSVSRMMTEGKCWWQKNKPKFTQRNLLKVTGNNSYVYDKH